MTGAQRVLALWLAAACVALPLRTSSTRASADVLRVCSDPNNLPFSNRAQAGFEDQLAHLLARSLGRSLSHYYWPQRRGFVRNTLKAGKCDVIMGVPADSDMLATTRPYYRSSYFFVTRADTEPVRSFGDSRLHSLRIGVPLLGDDYANPPPVHALSRRGIVDNVVGYSVFGDYREESPPLEPLRALVRRDVDVAIVWGPVAGFFAKHAREPLRLRAVTPRRDGPVRFTFALSVGVHPEARALRDALDQALQTQRAPIQELLHAYGVPQL